MQKPKPEADPNAVIKEAVDSVDQVIAQFRQSQNANQESAAEEAAGNA